MNKSFIKQLFIFVICAIVAIFNGQSLKSYDFNTQNSKVLEGLPPSLQVTSVALGPMKGLLADVIWWRAERMLEEKEFFESIQLADWLTAFQPTYPSVWEYQGFNLAFNISYNFSSIEERWKWIHEGIKLLRDKGIRNIPDWELNRKIRFQIVDIFSRKLSGVSDVEARRFQDFWTLEMLKYFDEGTKSELEKINEAPGDFEDLLRDAEVDLFRRNMQLEIPEFKKVVQIQPPSLKMLKEDLPENKVFNSSLTKIYRFSQKYRIQKELNMSVEKILKVDELYGPLDWRTHQAQIVYWGMEQDHKKFKSGGMQFSHYIRDALLSSFYNGRVLFSENKDYFMRTQNLEMLPRIHAFFDDTLSALDYGTVHFYRADKMHRDFLERAIVICYNYNQMEAAEELFDHYGDYLEEENRTMSFDQFIIQGMNRSLRSENFKSRQAFIESVLTRALEEAAMGEWDRYHGYVKLVKMAYNMHQKKHADSPARLLPPLKTLLKTAKDSYAGKSKKTSEQIQALESEAKKHQNPEKISTGHE